ncbi:MAG: hypothetical protein FJ138_05215 [Deltaproteobacteria bacterium]|nr:hypothetical protein [Deltaproteobacteria bacterium]
MNHSIPRRLTFELTQLASEIRTLDQFNESTTLNIHALSCLMRYAAWHDPGELRAWLQERAFTVNPGIIDRVELFTDLCPQGEEGARDGVELRVHIFRNGSETFKHSHKQDFISVCLQGSYRYRYYEARPAAEDDHGRDPSRDPMPSYAVYERKEGRQRLRERRAGALIEVRYERGVGYPHEGGVLFDEDCAPLFVDARHIHTVEHVSAEPVITFVARRGRWSAETEVWRGPRDEDPTLQNDHPPRPATPEERVKICDDVISALLRERGHRRAEARWSDIDQYLTPAHRALYLRAPPPDARAERRLRRFMEQNGVFSLPLLDAEGRCEALLSAPICREEDRDDPSRPLERIERPMVVEPRDPLLYALLGLLLNETFMIPVVDQAQRVRGLLTLDDLLEDPAPLGKALFWSLYEAQRDEASAVIHVRGLLSALSALRASCLIAAQKPTRERHDALVHEVLLHLDELITLNPQTNLGRARVEGPRGEAWRLARFPALIHEVPEGEEGGDAALEAEARWLLEALWREGGLGVVTRDARGEHALVTAGRPSRPLRVHEAPLSTREALDLWRDGHLPALVRDPQGALGLLEEGDALREDVLRDVLPSLIPARRTQGAREALLALLAPRGGEALSEALRGALRWVLSGEEGAPPLRIPSPL